MFSPRLALRFFAASALSAASAADLNALGTALFEDAECSGDGHGDCAMNALQIRGTLEAKVDGQQVEADEYGGKQSDAKLVGNGAADVAAGSQAPAEEHVAGGAGLVEADSEWSGVCSGGSMCKYGDRSSCESSIFGCSWKSSCPGYCSGSVQCKGASQSGCINSIFGCTWKCQYWNQDGVCTGGAMCTSYTDPSSCGSTIFGCKWGYKCSGYCSGSNMCRGNDQSKCVNSIFGCSWKCNGWR